MKVSPSLSVRLVAGALAAIFAVPALPARADGPIDHLKKRRQQIHEKVGRFFNGLGRQIEELSGGGVDYSYEVEPPPHDYRGDPRLAPPPHIDDEYEYGYRYEGPPRRYFPDGTPYPDPSLRERDRARDADRRWMEEEEAQYQRRRAQNPGMRTPYPHRMQGGRDRPLPAPRPSREVEEFPAPPKSGAPGTRDSPSRPLPAPAPMVESSANERRSPAKPEVQKTVPPPSVASGGESSGLKYGRPVPGKRGFAFPPGVAEETKNMIDVRDFQPGQKVKDPRTGEVFLVP